MHALSFVSYSQNLEDVMLWRALRHIPNGFYIDVGANDPHLESVTLGFYQRGWRGINIEPDLGKFAALVAARPDELNLNCALSDQPGLLTFYEVPVEGLSTLDRAIAENYRANGYPPTERLVEVMTLATLCERHATGPIHFLKIDVEGHEGGVLAGADFTRFRPWIVVLEATMPNSQEPSHAGWEPGLLAAGYRFVYFDGLNRFYVAEEQMHALAHAFALPPSIWDGYISESNIRQAIAHQFSGLDVPALQKLVQERDEARARQAELQAELDALRVPPVPAPPIMTVAMADEDTPYPLGAARAAAMIRAGTLTAERLVRDCLDRIEARDADVRAWSFIDPDQVLRTARELDKQPALSPLHGVPIGIKDMIDTVDMPTQHNSPIYRGHRPAQDAACVATLRAAGALIIGKTDTTEFAAAGRFAATRNPFDLYRTPGGSSSGSAAAVADGQVPLALGTQTGGSTIRPASFCGVFALKPTWGAVSREGVKLYSATLDTVSWFAREVEDLGLLADLFGLADDKAPHAVPAAQLRIALCRSPDWAAAEPATVMAIKAAAEALRQAGAVVEQVDLPPAFDRLGEMQATIMHAEGRAAFLSLARSHPHLLHDDFKARAENRGGITRASLIEAYDQAGRCRTEFDAIAAGYDAILTPSAKGVAPLGGHPGDAVFNRMWTLLHVPCVNLPGFKTAEGLPVGVTLVGARFTDRQLLQVAAAAAPVVGAG